MVRAEATPEEKSLAVLCQTTLKWPSKHEGKDSLVWWDKNWTLWPEFQLLYLVKARHCSSPSLWGSMMPALPSTSFGHASEQQVLKNWKNWVREVALSYINHFVRLFIPAYKYGIFNCNFKFESGRWYLCFCSSGQRWDIRKAFWEYLLVRGFIGIIQWGIACPSRQSFSLKNQRSRIGNVHGTDWCHVRGRKQMRRRARGLVHRQD